MTKIFETELHQCALLLADSQLPDGWELVGSSAFARVAFNHNTQIYYKEFLPRSPVENLKALIKGSRATRARKHSETLRTFGFNAPVNLVWGKLPNSREYLFTQAVPGKGVSEWLTRDLTGGSPDTTVTRQCFLQELGIFIGRFHASGFTHGDLRTSNVLAFRGINHFEFSLIDNERNTHANPASGKLLLKNLMQLNMHTLSELSLRDRLYFFHAWHSQMRDLSRLEAKLIASESYGWAMRRLGAKGRL